MADRTDYGISAALVFGRRDANEPEIVSGLRKCGILVLKMPRSIGFDLLLIGTQIGVVCGEVKNPEQPASKRRLTDHEREVKELIELKGGRYVILETTDDIAALLELPRQERF